MYIKGYVLELKNNRDWIGSSSEEWDIEIGEYSTDQRLGNRTIDGTSMEVYSVDNKIIAITTAAAQLYETKK